MPRHHWLLIMNETFAIKTWGRKAIQFLKSFYLSTIICFIAFTFSAETAYHALWFLYSVLILLLIEPSKETSSSCSLFLAFIIFFAKTLAQPTHFLLFGIKTTALWSVSTREFQWHPCSYQRIQFDNNKHQLGRLTALATSEAQQNSNVSVMFNNEGMFRTRGKNGARASECGKGKRRQNT